MDMNMVAFISGVVSVILGFLAIALSVIFYIQAKATEKETAKTLERIQAQAETLKSITDKHMTRLIRHATEQKPIEEILTIIATVKNLPDTNLQLHLQQREIDALTAQAIEGYIGSYYYSAVTNCLLQFYLPDAKSFDSTNPGHVFTKTMIDTSLGDFNNLKILFGRINQALIQSSPVYSYYTSAEQFWSPLIKDSATCFVDKEQGGVQE
ncbi:MAG: hypothetical protein NT088_02920 [Candidatus Omnitrophica bacterium]|nr:hypothetical protein [Candidatus Omnitrophota bacterium]